MLQVCLKEDTPQFVEVFFFFNPSVVRAWGQTSCCLDSWLIVWHRPSVMSNQLPTLAFLPTSVFSASLPFVSTWPPTLSGSSALLDWSGTTHLASLPCVFNWPSTLSGSLAVLDWNVTTLPAFHAGVPTFLQAAFVLILFSPRSFSPYSQA